MATPPLDEIVLAGVDKILEILYFKEKIAETQAKEGGFLHSEEFHRHAAAAYRNAALEVGKTLGKIPDEHWTSEGT